MAEAVQFQAYTGRSSADVLGKPLRLVLTLGQHVGREGRGPTDG